MSHSHHLDDLEDKITDFLHFGIKMQKQHKYDCSHIVNADQRLLNFNLPSNNTVQIKGNMCYNKHNRQQEQIHNDAILHNRWGKLPPDIIFKDSILDSEVYSAKRKAGWISSSQQLDEESVGKKTRKDDEEMLVLDAFHAHQTPEVKIMLTEEFKTMSIIIAGRMTSVLQPLNVTVNKTMKSILQLKWTEWYTKGQHTYTLGGRIIKYELEDICKWINTWDELDAAIIVKAYKKWRILNKLSSTKDDIIYEEFIQKSTEVAQEIHYNNNLADNTYYTVQIQQRNNF